MQVRQRICSTLPGVVGLWVFVPEPSVLGVALLVRCPSWSGCVMLTYSVGICHCWIQSMTPMCMVPACGTVGVRDPIAFRYELGDIAMWCTSSTCADCNINRHSLSDSAPHICNVQKHNKGIERHISSIRATLFKDNISINSTNQSFD